ncbi:hypothetical protein [Natrinema salifodinae]|nr:hypothetical protein [Natrinema salifodinae]
MSAEQRGPDAPVSAGDRTRPVPPTNPVESTAQDRQTRRQTSVSNPRELPLSYRIERTQLRMQVAALERAVETSEKRRQAIIDQYERLLADRVDESESTDADSVSDSQSLLTRLLAR